MNPTPLPPPPGSPPVSPRGLRVSLCPTLLAAWALSGPNLRADGPLQLPNLDATPTTDRFPITADVHYIPEASSSLGQEAGDWSGDGLTVIEEGIADGLQTVRVIDTNPLGSPKRFMRLRVLRK